MKLKIQIKIILFFLILVQISIFSQQNRISTNFETKIHQAVELYNSRLYSSAQKLFKETAKSKNIESSVKAKADYYDALCSIKLKQTRPDKKVMDFVKKYPNSSLKQKAYYNVGNYYYSNKKPAHALKWYTKVDPSFLTEEQVHEMNFKMGYMLLLCDFYADAKEKFRTLLGSPDYGNDSRYYYGYISYRQENYEEANENFAQLANNASYQSEANYYLLDMAFKNGDFKKAIEIGEKILPKHEKDKKGNKSDITKIIGESYFNLGKYKESIPYLLQYKDQKGKWNNTNLYYIGYAYYKQDNFKKAEEYFTKIISGNNVIAQNAYYHLGICYLKSNKKTEALNAFKNAYEMPFKNEVQIDAALNYTKLSYEEGNPYKSISETLKEFINKYPNSEESSKIKDLLISSYLHDKDFVSALEYLSKNKNPENDKLSIEVSLYRGIQLFQEKNYRAAIPFLLIASSSEDDKIKNKAYYWMAESQYLIGKYQNALKDFNSVDKSVLPEDFKNIDYNIAYCLFKLNRYEQAASYFKKYIESDNTDLSIKDDAINRLGDSNYALRDYKNAIKNYNIIIDEDGSGADYALYQRAMSKNLINSKKGKIEDLKKLVNDYPESVYIDDALYQTAITYNSLKKEDEAVPYFNKIINEYPKSSYIPASVLRQGLYLYGKKDYDSAISKFKEVVAKFPSSEEAKQAITNTRNVYIDKGNIEPYIAWVKTLPNINISKREIDDSSYTAAQSLFFNDDFITATISLKSYMNKFPEGAHLLKVNYYLGESYYNLNQKKRAIEPYRYVMNQEKNEYTEDVTAKLAEIYIDLNQWKDALPVLEKLMEEANLEHNLLFAKNSLMKVYFEQKKYEKAKQLSEEVLRNTKLDQSTEEDAKLIIARVAMIEKDTQKAREYYQVLDKTATEVVKAETLYHKALFLHQDEAYKASNEEIQSLIAGYSKYKYWGVKSYIVMAKNYFKLRDSYQATYILENIVKNFTKYPTLVEEAKNELNKIKHQESKQNESINSNIGN